ncbi:MAG: hypothetical protein WCA77_04040 [Thermoplasmata archaeon]
MNRSVVYLGVLALVLALGLFAYPVAVSGSFQLVWETDLAIIALPASLMTILWGATLPDPSLTTVGGVFGSPEENELRRQEAEARAAMTARYRSSPHEPTHCRKCYTMVTYDLALCPRCGTARLCRSCAKPLFYLSGAVRCGPCVQDENYCTCPPLARPAHEGLVVRRRTA